MNQRKEVEHMAEVSQNVLNKDLQDLESEISLIAVSDSEKYEEFKLRLNKVRESLFGLNELEFEKKKNSVIEEITNIQLDYDSYMDDVDVSLESSLKNQEETTSGRTKLRKHRIELYKSIMSDFKKLKRIPLDDLKKVREKFNDDKNGSDYQFSPFEISMIEEGLANSFLEYQIKELQAISKLPKEKIEDFTTKEEYLKAIKSKLIENLKEKSHSVGDKLEIDTLLKEENLEKILNDSNFWKLLVSKSVNISNENIDTILNKEKQMEESKSEETALVPAEVKKKSVFSFFKKKEPKPYIKITFTNGSERTYKFKNGIGRVDGSGIVDVHQIKEIFVSEGITQIKKRYIDEEHNRNLENLEKVHLPSTLETIGAETFYSCRNLRSIEFPSSLKSIGNAAFFNTGLTEIKLPDSVESIGKKAFCNCKNLRSIELPSSLKYIGTYAFWGSGLTEIKLPDSVESIGKEAFYNCKNLEKIKLPQNLKILSKSTFYGCERLKQVIFPEGIEQIEDRAFEECRSLETITLPKSLEILRERVFKECNSLKKVKMNGKISMIEPDAFSGCSSLNMVEVPADYEVSGRDREIYSGNGSRVVKFIQSLDKSMKPIEQTEKNEEIKKSKEEYEI